MAGSTNGIKNAGLLSGLDTENLVKQMASLTKSKINRQKQKLQSLQWKQESYRSVISKIKTFKDTYLNALNPETNIGSNYLMASFKATSSNSAVTATASSTAAEASYKITNIAQLATAAQVTSNGGAVNAAVQLDFSKAAEEAKKAAEASTDFPQYTVKVTLDGLSREITFTADEDASISQQHFVDALNAQLGTSSNSFTMDDKGRLTLNSTDGYVHSFTVGVSDKAPNKNASMAAIGLENNTSNKISTSAKLGDISFAKELKGDNFSFNINGVDFSFNKNTTVAQMIKTVNSSSANVTMSFDSLSQSFSLKASQEGQGGEISISQSSGNLLNALFNNDEIAEGNKDSSVSVMGSSLTGTKKAGNLENLVNNSIKITVNGVTKEVGFYKYDGNGDKNDISDTVGDDGVVTKTSQEKIVELFNKELKNAFGGSAPTMKYTAAEDGGGYISFETAGANDIISFNAVAGNSDSARLVSALGFEVTDSKSSFTNKVNADEYKLSENGLNLTRADGSAVSLTGDVTIQDLVDEGLVSYDETTGVMTALEDFTAADDDSKAVLEKFFGKSSISGSAVDNAATNYQGQNAVVTINGVTLTNSSNSIEIDGTTINLGGLTQDGINKINAGEAVTVSTKRDTEKAYDAVVKFINDYNKLIDELNKETSTSRPKSNGAYYDPLTEEQEEEMTDKQIENWEEKAKQGLLYNDSRINSFVSKLSDAVTNTYTSDNFCLFNMGIEFEDSVGSGKLIIRDEAKFKQAFENNAEQIQELFTDKNNGLAARVTKAVDSAISTTRGSYGSLTMVAGVENTASQGSNEISKQIDAYNEMISKLQKKYEAEQERYWSKFTALEKAMAQWSTQASIFTDSSSQ